MGFRTLRGFMQDMGVPSLCFCGRSMQSMQQQDDESAFFIVA
jgi:hypothetical protein